MGLQAGGVALQNADGTATRVSNLGNQRQISGGEVLFSPSCTYATNPTDGLRQVVFMDLDNTLIPTSWIMSEFRMKEKQCHHGRLVTAINTELVQAGLFESLDDIFARITKLSNNIIIVTNAGSRTVESFYLTYCLPQLRNLLVKYNIRLVSTEDWVLTLGPPPAQEDEDDFREFYTAVKFCEFKSCLQTILETLPPEETINIVSVGDQMCEISAACRAGLCEKERINLIKLILILDPTNSRFSFQQPGQFVEQLTSLSNQLALVMSYNVESLVEMDKWRSMTSFSLKMKPLPKLVSHWVPQKENMTFAIGKSERFPSEFPFYLPCEYHNLSSQDPYPEIKCDSGIPEDLYLTTTDTDTAGDEFASYQEAMAPAIDINSSIELSESEIFLS